MFAEPVTQLAVFIFEPRQPKRVFDRDEQFVRGERLFEKIERAQLRGFHRHLDIRLPGNENNRSLQTGLLQIREQFQSTFSWHHDIGKNQVKRSLAKQVNSTSSVVANRGFMPSKPEGTGKRG